MSDHPSLFLGASEKPEQLLLALANRHGLIAGATGTGKTVSLQIMAESFSAEGVPVFVADVKGDLAGLAAAGVSKPFLEERAQTIAFEDYQYKAFPVIFWDLYGKQGHPVRTTISEMGPLLLSRLLGLNETQEGVLAIAFEVADDEGLLLLDLKDLRSLLVHVAEQAKEITTTYGNVSRQSVGAIQRRLLTLEQQGAEEFFGEPALQLDDLMRLNEYGEGYINILAADKLMLAPGLYATFLLWLLSELFEALPEVGDPDRPKLVFFFDEAHLLFDDAPKALVEKVELVVRLIRSKGVGVYFVTQNPLDIPEDVLGQLGNRVQHALRAFTPKDQKAVRAAAETFRQNPAFDAETAITELGVGEALVSTLEKKGVPSMVARTLIRPPSSRLGPLTDEERAAVMAQSPVTGLYDRPVDRRSAYEILKARAEEAANADPDPLPTRRSNRQMETRERVLVDKVRTSTARKRTGGRQRQTASEAMMKSAARQIGRQLGRQILRGVFGSLRR